MTNHFTDRVWAARRRVDDEIELGDRVADALEQQDGGEGDE